MGYLGGVLFVDRLLADLKNVGDLLPGPAAASCVGDLQCLQLFGEATQGSDGTQADRRVCTAGRGGEFSWIRHVSTLVDTTASVNLG